MPNCKEHADCDLVCSEHGYYCNSEQCEVVDNWRHRRRQDMPDDIEAYRNERAEEMP